MQKIDDLKEPPKYGQYYLVPCAIHRMDDKKIWIPIRGPMHSDKELGAPDEHWHPDTRFTRKANPALIMIKANYGEVRYRRMKCIAPNHGLANQISEMRCETNRMSFLKSLDKVCAGKRMIGNVCPHNGMRLDQTVPDGNCVTCPLHGARWRTDTGEYVPYTEAT